jgi:hypothetical protein
MHAKAWSLPKLLLLRWLYIAELVVLYHLHCIISRLLSISYFQCYCINCIVPLLYYQYFIISCIVTTALYELHCINCIALIALHQLHCINCTVWVALYKLHCINYIASITLFQLGCHQIWCATKQNDCKHGEPFSNLDQIHHRLSHGLQTWS